MWSSSARATGQYHSATKESQAKCCKTGASGSRGSVEPPSCAAAYACVWSDSSHEKSMTIVEHALSRSFDGSCFAHGTRVLSALPGASAELRKSA